MKHYKRDKAILIGMFITLFAMVAIIAYIAVNDGIPLGGF